MPATGIGGWNEQAVARLALGADPAALEREIRGLFRALREEPGGARIVAQYLDEARVTPAVALLRDSVVGDVRVTLWVLFGTVGFVLIVAVANVGNLFLVRAGERQRELAVRRALGASLGRLVQTAMAESLLVALAAGLVALLATITAIRGLRLFAPGNIPRLHEIGLTPQVALLLMGLTLGAGVLLGLLPAVRRRRRLEPGGGPIDAARPATAGRTAARSRDLLMAAQVALALLLLIGSGLLFRSYVSLRAVDLGFTERQGLTFELGLPETRYNSRAAAKDFHDRVIERVRALPGVTAAGAVGGCLPLSGGMCWGDVLDVEGRPRTPGELPPVTGVRIVAGDYFRAIGLHVRGRLFTPADAHGDASAAILSQAAADAYFPGEDPLGRRVRFDTGAERWHIVVGVAADVRSQVATDAYQRVIYLPVLPEGRDGPHPVQMSYVLRSAAPPETLAAAARAAVAEHDPAIPLAALQTLADRIDRATAPAAFALAIVGVAASVALVLGLVGVYAVVTYAVTQRTREIGVRLALGARPADVRRMVMRSGGRSVVTGAIVGVAGALGLTRLMEAMLHGVTATDPASFTLLTALLIAVAAVALWLPARRASRIDPMVALRTE